MIFCLTVLRRLVIGLVLLNTKVCANYLVLTDDTLQVIARSNVCSGLLPTQPNYCAYALTPVILRVSAGQGYHLQF